MLSGFHDFNFYTYEHLKTDKSEVWKMFFAAHIFSDIKTTFRLQKPQCKIFDGHTFTMKVESPLLVVS